MIVRAIKTAKIKPNSTTIFDLLDASIQPPKERSVIVITSKVISLCEGRVTSEDTNTWEELIRQEADLYHFPGAQGTQHEYHFTIVKNTLIPASGIDKSNGDGWYVFWPQNPQATANEICAYLKKRFGIKELGVLITDSTVFPSRWGTLGIAIGYSGFEPVKNYIGKPDVFGKELKISKANIAGGLSAAAVATMGEGAEQTPIAIIEDIAFVDFKADNPTQEELDGYYISPRADAPFAPFYNSVEWFPGGGGSTRSTI